jgi:hypothetical protein
MELSDAKTRGRLRGLRAASICRPIPAAANLHLPLHNFNFNNATQQHHLSPETPNHRNTSLSILFD